MKQLSRVKFTASTAEKFCCPDGLKEALIWDDGEKTLCLRARVSGRSAYYFQSRFGGKVVKIKIGDTSDIGVTLHYARATARGYQADIDKGIDPRSAKRAAKAIVEAEKESQLRESLTVEIIWNEYVAANAIYWSPAYHHDHNKAMQAGGSRRMRSKKKTVSGALYSLRNQPISDLTPTILTDWVKSESAKRPTVTANAYRMLRACLNWMDGQERYYDLLRVDRLLKNSELKRALPKSKPKQDCLQSQHLKSWFEAIESECDQSTRAYLTGLLLTGARREELATLKWVDTSLKWNSIKIRDKVDESREIPLTPYLKSIIESLPRVNDWVFSSGTSRSGRLVDPYRAHQRALDKAELPHVSLHGLRRSFGSLAEWVECPVGIVAQIQGHKPSAIAEKHYRVRPLDLLLLWHTRIEQKILEFSGIEFSYE